LERDAQRIIPNARSVALVAYRTGRQASALLRRAGHVAAFTMSFDSATISSALPQPAP
jgi:hypothetical protein